jgi:class 3 adenylate cyclase/tetratricopeptide (TPR) repeat protein
MAVARKTVTVLFADVADSTGLGERLDPESVRSALACWFDVARSVLERHGGTVEKFIGDAVMAVFGVPRLHEDDAVRALRAAAELRIALERLNSELEREHGIKLAVRIGLNTGEVVAGDGGEGNTLVTGDAVNVAKRLEESADAGEIVVGEVTERLARASGEFEALEPIPARGKMEPVPAWRVIEVDRDAAGYERRFDIPLVGRLRELEQLRRAYGRALAERTCHLFTLLGPAGIGKSRLSTELFDELADEATILTGRCLPYGDGITFWPLAEVIQELGTEEGIEQLMADMDDGELVVERLCGATGRATVESQETFWAVRKLCEALAQDRPLVLCFEDVHWAEPTFLDLIEYLAGWIRDAPMLLICLARPEFLDDRPSWLSGRENAASLTLSPLSATDSEALLDALGAEGDARLRIAEAAEGNPLYAEQMAAMVAEGGYAEGLFTIPPTIQALLAARLDRLSGAERAAIERAAVCGKEFWREAVVELTPREEREQIGPVLMALVRKELIRPHRSTARPDDAFGFGHVLIRDAAYAAIPKQARARLHEEFAGWLGVASGDRAAELEEILGYHLEQAYLYREQLAPIGDEASALGRRAGELLGAAGHRATARGDAPAAANLLRRALRLAPASDGEQLGLMIELGRALRGAGDLAQAQHVFREAEELARAADDARAGAHASLESAFAQLHTWESHLDDLLPVSDKAAAVFESAGDDDGLSQALMLRAYVTFIRCRMAETEEIVDRAIRHARRAGDEQQVNGLLHIRARAALRGPTPVATAIEHCEAVRRLGDRPLVAIVSGELAQLEAMRGRFDEARALAAEGQRILRDLGRALALGALQADAGAVELLGGDAPAAARCLRSACDTMEAIGEKGYLSTFAALLAEALFAQGDDEEASRYTRLSEETALAEDVLSQVLWRKTRARLLCRQGELEESGALARQAVALAEQTDDLNLTGDALANLGAVLGAAGMSSEAAAAYTRASSLYEQKGNVVSATRAREHVRESAVRI